MPNNSIFLENHLKAAKEIPAFKLLVTLLESEIKEKTKPILTKEDQYSLYFLNNSLLLILYIIIKKNKNIIKQRL